MLDELGLGVGAADRESYKQAGLILEQVCPHVFTHKCERRCGQKCGGGTEGAIRAWRFVGPYLQGAVVRNL